MKRDDAALLKRFEPILRFTRGEKFFPISIDRYLASCSMWVHRPGLGAERVYKEGEVSRENLAEVRSKTFGSVQYLKFIEPLNVAQLASFRLQALRREKRRKAFHAGPGRLARVGYSARLLDAIFSLTLLTRGRVPGDTAAAAALTYERMQEEEAQHSYYGRVIEEAGWLVLQYWFFYPFNNWRSGYFGLNDHEGDWEMINIYLYKNPSSDWQPEWVAYASHDFEGDDLRRRWDDEEIEREGEHPIVYVGAGSHASYFQKGEYMTELVIPLLSPLISLSKRIANLWRNLLGEDLAPDEQLGEHLFHIPFVDYARGEGHSIGMGQDIQWDNPNVISEDTQWVQGYRGLWGLWTQDPVMGENAPGGPMYDRFGRVRRAWYDPLGWAGLNKISPPNKALERANRRQDAIEQRRQSTKISLAEKANELQDMGLEAEAMRSQPHLREQYREHKERIRELSHEIDEERAQAAEDRAIFEAVSLYATELKEGARGFARTHLRRPLMPSQELNMRFGRIAEAWAATSIGLGLIAFVGIALFAPQFLLLGVVGIIGVVAIVEATFRRRLSRLINILTGTLAIVASVVLIYEFFLNVIIIVILIAGSYLLWENLRELWS